MLEKGAEEISVISVTFLDGDGMRTFIDKYFWRTHNFRWLSDLQRRSLDCFAFDSRVVSGSSNTAAPRIFHRAVGSRHFSVRRHSCLVGWKAFTEEITSLFISSASLGGALLSFLIGWAIDASAAAVFRFCCSADWGLAAGDQRGDFYPACKNKQSHLDM